jgi:hypothetical protein
VNIHPKVPALLPLCGAATLAQFLNPRDPARDRSNFSCLRTQLGKLPQLISGEKQAETDAYQGEDRGFVRNLIDEQTAQNAYQD